MGMLAVLTIVAVAAATLGLWVYRRWSKAAGTPNVKTKARSEAEYWGVQITSPPGDRACAQVQEFLGKAFSVAEKPSLPLPDCPFAHQCQCRYIKLLDRRKYDRRSGHDRRPAGLRFETDKTPRRSGNDRRKKVDWY